MSTLVPPRASDTSRYLLDRSLATLRSTAGDWATRPIESRIGDLGEIMRRTIEVAPDLVSDALRAKGAGPEVAGEEWASGPLGVLRTIRFLRSTLRGIRRRGEVPLDDRAIRERPDGQVVVDVLPADPWDRILYPRWRAEVRMAPSVSRPAARRAMGGFYTKDGRATPAVSAILGAGNVTAIAPLDLVHKLFVEGQVAVLKFNPVNDYIGPYIEHAFGELIAAGFVRTAYGGVGVGDHLVTHPEVDTIHITGSEESHDAIVFGSGDEGARRKARREPRLHKPITSELGNVSPVVVLPGQWSRRAMWYQAGHIATQLVQNAGYNCNAVKVLVLPEAWPQREEFLEMIAQRLGDAPVRPAYYPGSEERYRRVLRGGGELTACGPGEVDLPPAMVVVDPGSGHPAFAHEAFCRLMAVVSLPGEVEEFLDRAVDFCNDRLRGTLNATLVVDPSTLDDHRVAVDRAIDRLRYGTVGLNLWAAAGFPLGVTPWGAFPGQTLDDIGSGIGFVHNARLIDHPHKTVVSAPFVQVPHPPWSVFHRRSGDVLSRTAAFEADPRAWRIPGIVAPAIASGQRRSRVRPR